MALTADEDFILKTAALARRASQEWNEFLLELKKQSDSATAAVLVAPQEAILAAQGRAYQLDKLHKQFSAALEKAKTLQDKLK